MNKYLQYDSVDFAQEQSFVRWVRGSHSEDVAFWQEWITQNPDKKDEIDKAILLVNQIVFKENEVEQGAKEKVWSGIEGGIYKDQKSEKAPISNTTKSKGKVLRLATLAAVAAVAIFCFMVNTNNNFDTTIQTKYADIQTIALPDGSTVELNSNSKLSYDTKNWETDRKIELDGEAFFEVKKGSSFVVETKNGDVKVLGTSFNVYTRESVFNVHCKTGKVSVTTGNDKSILIPNQSVLIKDQRHKFFPDVNERESRSNWKSGVYTYKGVAIGEVIDELERQLDITIEIPNILKDKEFTGSFNTGNIDNALSEVLWPLDLKYTLEGRNVIVTE